MPLSRHKERHALKVFPRLSKGADRTHRSATEVACGGGNPAWRDIAKSLEKQGLETSEWKEACNPGNGYDLLNTRCRGILHRAAWIRLFNQEIITNSSFSYGQGYEFMLFSSYSKPGVCTSSLHSFCPRPKGKWMLNSRR